MYNNVYMLIITLQTCEVFVLLNKILTCKILSAKFDPDIPTCKILTKRYLRIIIILKMIHQGTTSAVRTSLCK